MSGAAIPVLETERLRLRGRTVDDFPYFEAMWGDPNVVKFITGEPQSRETTWGKFLRSIGHWEAMGFGYWLVEERETGKFAGEVGFGEFKRELEPVIEGEPEIGWVLCADAHGKGYATEAAKAAIAWGDQHFKQGRMSCIIEEGHAASIHVAEKCGFSGTAKGRYHDANLIVLHRAIPS